jgi:hypothetical protein
MSSQAFFWVNVGLGVFLILIFLIGKKGIVAPSRLNLKRGWIGHKIRPVGPQFRSPPSETAPEGLRAKDLNIMFVYNGHTFDAYEVIGVPAGASFEMVQKFYKEAISRRGGDREFLEAAFNAIRKASLQS